MKAYLANELVKTLRYPYIGLLLIFLILTAWVLTEGFAHDALTVFPLWHQKNPTKHFEDFMFGSLQQQLNLILFLAIALLCTVSFYVDRQARFFARRLALPLHSTNFLLAKLLMLLGLAAVMLLVVSGIFHGYITKFEPYFTNKSYTYGLLLLDFGTRLLLFIPLLLLVILLILLTRFRMIVALLLALSIFYAARVGWMPFGAVHQLSLLTGNVTVADLVLPALVWTIILFSLTNKLLQSNNY